MPDNLNAEGKTVTFILPGGGGVPTGGFKVAYEYANALADRGWRVRVVHPCMVTREEIAEVRSTVFLRARRWLGYQRRRFTGDYRPSKWFKVHRNVELLCTKTLEPRYIPPSDVWVATWWYTANWAAAYGGAGAYLIQHLETWCGPEAHVMATWKLPLHKIVISRWLEDIARSLGEPSYYVPNGLDFRTFGMDVAPEDRDPHTVAMLYHTSDWKGSSEGLRALQIAKQKVPGLRAVLFGVPAPPPDLPDWVEYHQNPPQKTLRQIYNRAAIFISPSWAEGWALPPAESLQCGAALVATDIGGHREYSIHGQTALLSPPKDPDALSANILRVLEDQQLRLRLAHQGYAHVQQFTWDRAVNSFEIVLKDAISMAAENRSSQLASKEIATEHHDALQQQVKSV
jgi:glycosyltransferase involved in cell wall biosynthesis